MRDRRVLALLGVLLLFVGLTFALRVWVLPRPLTSASNLIVVLRSQAAVAALVLGAGSAVAGVAAQARARDRSVDATLTGAAWGVLPAVLLPVGLPWKLLIALAGCYFTTRLSGRGTGTAQELARGLAVAGLVGGTAATGLFLVAGLTPTTATALLYAGLGGLLGRASVGTSLAGGSLVVLAAAVLVRHWRTTILVRAGVRPAGPAMTAALVLASAGAGIVGGVAPGLGLLALYPLVPIFGDNPQRIVPAAMAAGGAAALLLDGVAQALAWPGILPLGLLTGVLASGLLLLRGVGR